MLRWSGSKSCPGPGPPSHDEHPPQYHQAVPGTHRGWDGVITAAAHAQRDEAPVARTNHYKTPCTINGYPSWCALSAMGNITNSLKVEFAHGDQPIFQWVPISQARDQSGGLEMREITSGTMWGLKEYGFTSLNEIGGLNSICVGKHARLPYPRGCAKP